MIDNISASKAAKRALGTRRGAWAVTSEWRYSREELGYHLAVYLRKRKNANGVYQIIVPRLMREPAKDEAEELLMFMGLKPRVVRPRTDIETKEYITASVHRAIEEGMI